MTILRAVLKQRLGSVEVRNVLYYAATNALGSLDLQDVTDEIAGWWTTSLKQRFHSTWQLYEVEYDDAEIAGEPAIIVGPTGGPVVGNGSGDALPYQIAALISFRAVSIPPNKARTYLGGLTEGIVTAGTWASAAVTDFNTWGNNSLSITTEPNVGSRLSVRLQGSPAVAVASNALSIVRTSSVAATQRRRRPGVGI